MIDTARLYESYEITRKQLFQNYSNPKMKLLSDHYLQALLIADACMLALMELPACANSISGWVKRKSDDLLEEQEKSVIQFEHDVQMAMKLNTADAKGAIDILKSTADIKVKSLKTHQEIYFTAGEFLLTGCNTWFESIEDLFKEDASIMRERLKIALGFFAGKIPVIGEFFDVAKLTLELNSIHKKRAETAGEYMEWLESFIAAGKIWLEGVFSFIARIQTLDQLDSPVPEQRMKDLLEEHLQKASRNLIQPTDSEIIA